MPYPSEHLATAEDLAMHARSHAEASSWKAASIFTNLSAIYVQMALARQSIITTATEEPPDRPTVELPEWCGNCDGPDLAMRWVSVSSGPESRVVMARCRECNPYAPNRVAMGNAEAAT